MKIRVYKCQDGSVMIDTPSERYQSKIEECPHPGCFRNGEPFEMEVMEYEDLLKIAEKNEGGGGQFYYDGSTLKHDDEWSECLMSPGMIRRKQVARLEARIEKALAAENVLEVVRLGRDLDKLKRILDPRELYRMALKTLEEEKIDKPTIVKKLLEKIG